MGNAHTTNTHIIINTKYSKLEQLIKDFRKNIETLKKIKIKSFEEYDQSDINQTILNIQKEINDELIKIRNFSINSIANINEYTKTNMKINKYVFDIQRITQEYFEVVKNKTKSFIYI